jgi:hypothetical protein
LGNASIWSLVTPNRELVIAATAPSAGSRTTW